MTEMNATEEQLNESLTPAEPKEQNTGAQQPETKKQKRMRIGREALILLLSFAVPAAIFAGFWAVQGITWNGEVTPLIYDMRAQYMPFMASLRYVLNGEGSLFYDWSLGMGGSYLSMFAYYIASPLNLITVLFPLEEMPNAIYLLTLLKIGLAGLTFSVYLRFGFEKKTAYWSNIAFASCYALMSYNVTYSLCLMWLDGIILLPLILLGIEQLFAGKRGFLYFISMTTLFFSNYYISYMVGIFAALYIVCGAVVRLNKKNKKELFAVLLRFAVNTIMGLCISALLLYPALKAYFATVNEKLVGEKAYEAMFDFSVAELLQKLQPQQYDSVDYVGRPEIYCSSLAVILFLVYFLQKRKLREKLCTAALALFFGIAFMVPHLDYALHGFRVPHGFLYRYSFLLSTVIVITAYRARLRLDISSKIGQLVTGVLILYTFGELFMNGSVIVSGLNEEVVYLVRPAYQKLYSLYPEQVEYVKEEGELFRLGLGVHNNDLTSNDCVMFHIPGIDYFSSTYNVEVMNFLNRSGGKLHASFSTSSRALSIVMDSLLGIRYRVNSEEMKPPYEKVNEIVNLPFVSYLYRNEDALSFGYTIPDGMLGNDITYDSSVFENQNAFAKAVSNLQEDIYAPVFLQTEGEVKHNELTCSFRSNSTQTLYLFLNIHYDMQMREKLLQEGQEIPMAQVIVDNKVLYEIDASDPKYGMTPIRVYELFLLDDGDEHTVSLMAPDFCYTQQIALYEFNEQQYKNVIQKLRDGELHVSEYGPDWLRGEVAVGEDECLFFTIPYLEGLEVKVDGERKEVVKTLGPFSAVAVSPGTHRIEVYYRLPGAKTGLLLFLIGVISALYYYFLNFYVKNTKKACK